MKLNTLIRMNLCDTLFAEWAHRDYPQGLWMYDGLLVTMTNISAANRYWVRVYARGPIGEFCQMEEITQEHIVLYQPMD